MSASPPVLLRRLSLGGFRSYDGFAWSDPGRVSVITGPNGSGKTNLLEALSLLVPGRGLRGARLAELPRGGAGHWGVAARFSHGEDGFDLSTGTTAETAPGRRVFRLDGQPPRHRGAIAERLSAVWLTPQMDRLFTEGPGGRRRFLDRLVLAAEPGHATEVAAHDEAMRSRNRLLGQEQPDRAWLAALEASMARHAVAVTAARRGLVSRMNRRLQDDPGDADGFPPVRLRLECPIATRLDEHPAVAVEDWLRSILAESRAIDARAGSARHGAHRADLFLSDARSGQDAALASTGQQKAMLIGAVLAHASLLAELAGEAPMLLLDEPLVHLDAHHRLTLLRALAAMPSQVLLTGTDPEGFAPLAGVAAFFRARQGPDGLSTLEATGAAE
ncbi:DNA replication/repair protein RecF [Rhizosaccharibacter radicis]|uniref:DNA replication and repair protein RecF n=1 Tax=Rhizosaccharibacter radicis TaxID=2782605 RepID=A0ABT1VWQ6_9PROT|nr:DNA replication/repair protein RecF [Acetobacteraceae bacterium KSS12]